MALIVAAVFGKQRSVCSGAGEAAAFGVAAGSVPPSAGHAVSATSTAAAPAASLLDDANLIDTLLHQASFSYSATGRVADTNLSFQHVGGHGATQLAPNTMQQKRRERARQLHMQLTEQAAWSRAEQHVLHAETLPTLPPSFTKAADAGLRVCGGVRLVGPGYSTLIAMVPTVRTVQCIAEDDELISSPRAYRYDARHSHHNKAYMMTEQAASMPVASLPLPTRGSTAVAPPTATMTRLHPDVQRRVQPLLDSVRASALVDVGALPDDVCEALRAHAAALRRGGNDGGGCDDGGGDDGDGARERRVEDDASGGQVNEDGRDASAGEAAEAGAAERSALQMSLTPQAPRRHTSKPSGTWPFRSVDRDAAARVQAARAGLPSAATSSAAQRVAKYEPRYTVVQPRVTGGYMKPPPSTLSPRRRHDTQFTTAAASAAASAHGMPYALSSTMTNVTTSASHGTATTPTVDNNSSYNTASAHGPVNDKDGHNAQEQQQQLNNNNNNNTSNNTAAMRICSVTTPSLAATERDDAASLAATMTMMLDTTSRFSTTSTAVGCGDAGDDAGSAVRSRCASGHRPVRRGMQQAHDQRQQPQQALQQAPRTAALVRHGSGATTVAGGEGGGAGVSETEDSAAARAAAAAARLRYKHNVKGSSMFLSRTSRSSSPSLSRRQQRRCRPHTTHKDNNDDDDDHTDDDAYDAPAASSSAGCYWPYPDVRSTTRRVRCAVRFAHSVTHRRRAPLVAGVPVGAYDVTTDVSAQRHCTVDMRYTTSRETHWTSRTRAPPTGTAAAGGGGGSTLDVERAWRATLPSAHTARLSPRVDVTRHDQQQQPRQQQREQPLRGVSVEANLSYPPPTLGSAAALARVRAFDKMRSRDDVTRDAAAAAAVVVATTATGRTQRRGARGSAFAGTRGAGDDRDDYDGINGSSDEDDAAAAAAAAITSPRTRAAHIHARAPGHKPLYTASVHTELGNVASLALVRPRVRCTANLASAARQDMSGASAVAGSDDKKGSGRRLPPLAHDVVYDTAAARAHIEPRVRGDPMMATAVSREVRARHTRDGHNGQAATTTTTARTNAGAASTTAMTTAAMAALSLPTTATTTTTAATTDATYSSAAVEAALRPHPKLVPDFDKQITKETQFAGHRVVSERWLRTHPTAPGPGSYTVSYTQVE